MFAGVFGQPDPAAALAALGVESAWSDARVAFGGAPVWHDPDRGMVVCGDVLLDNLSELQQELALPDAGPAAIVGETIARFGPTGARRLLGMIAAAVWHAPAGTLTLIRDSCGARTLYYAGDGARWWFAGRTVVLRRAPVVSGQIDLESLRNYLICAFVPGTRTMLRDIRELAPGATLTLPGEVTTPFWQPDDTRPPINLPITAYVESLRPVLEQAVRVRLPGAGAVGIYLSGGLDSSLVTALAAQYALGPVHTYAIHFGTHLPNELEYSGMVAEHCRTVHHVLELTPRMIQQALSDTLAALDDPIGDPLTVPNLLLGRAAANDTGVILNGEGGDPVFGGPKNGPMLLHALYGGGESAETAYLRSFQKCFDDLPKLLSVDVQRALRVSPPAESLVAPFLNPDEGSVRERPMHDYLDRLFHLNVRLKGCDQILTKVSNLTEAAGVLGRSPLFDRRVVEAGFAVPPAYKRDGADEKAVLKLAVADLLPEAILSRPKSGMLVPVQHWFRRDLRPLARSLLLGRDARIRPYLNQSLIRSWLDYEGSVWPRHGVKLWLVLALEGWLRAHEQPPAAFSNRRM